MATEEIATNHPLKLVEDDVVKFLACQTHLGATTCDQQMKQYVWKRKADGQYVINLSKTWEKLVFAARAIAAIENPPDVCVITSRPQVQRAILKYAVATGASSVAGRYTPGTFTNQIQRAFKEPRLLVISDPRADHQPITESACVNIPVIAFCNTDSPLKFVDIAIPCNTKSPHSIGLMWWMLAREVLRMRGTISRDIPWNVMVDLYFYRDPELEEKEEQEAAAAAIASLPVPPIAEYHAPADDWNDTNFETPAVQGFGRNDVVADVAANEISVTAAQPVVTDWSAEPAGDWSADVAVGEWGGGAADTWG